MSLADELLADLDEYGGDEEADGEEDGDKKEADNDEIDEVTEDDQAMQVDAMNYDRVTSVARLTQSANYKRIIQQVETALARGTDYYKLRGPVEHDPEYKLVVDVNMLAVEIDNEVNVIHKFVRDKYSRRFPELESMVPNAHEYMACVRELGNDISMKGENREAIAEILQPATVIVVSVTASTSQGEMLTPEELDAVYEACQMATLLQDGKQKLFTFVEQRMSYIAPNLTNLVGAGAAAMLMGKAGGLLNLSKMPSCNVLVLGATKKVLAGFSSSAVLPHCGYLYFSPLVQRLPDDLRRKAARQLAGKCALCSRVDACHSASDGSVGRRYAAEVANKFEKWLEPPPTKSTKALPKPIDKSSKKRGGRRARKEKERLGLSDMRRKHNRMNFAEIQEDVSQTNLGYTLGQLKTSNPDGKIRSATVDQKSRVRMSKVLQKQMIKANAGIKPGQLAGLGVSSSVRGKATAGTASSVSFTPVQGLEIINPMAQAAERAVDGNVKYFNSTAGFINVRSEIDPIPIDRPGGPMPNVGAVMRAALRF